MSAHRFGRDRLASSDAACRHEWLTTNGIGGHASGTLGGVLTRRHHGLLVAALDPPGTRRLMLAKFAETLEIDGTSYDLDANRWSGGILKTPGLAHLESFALEDSVPVWTYVAGGTRVERRVWMEHGENTTYVQYRVASGHAPVTLRLGALVNHRDAAATLPRGDWNARVEPAGGGVRIEEIGRAHV
jgi:predicted glycogen debranching enzyme